MESTTRILNEIESKGFSVCDNFISLSEVKLMLSKINSLLNEKKFKQAGIGNKNILHTNTTIRSDTIFWVEKDDKDLQSVFFEKIDPVVTGINRHFYLGINDYEFHLAHYPPGAFYKKHRDAFKSDDARKISMILYLNLNWKKEHGGELKLYRENGEELTVEPIAGRLLVFESYLEHEVMESKTDRFSITGWLKSKSRSF